MIKKKDFLLLSLLIFIILITFKDILFLKSAFLNGDYAMQLFPSATQHKSSNHCYEKLTQQKYTIVNLQHWNRHGLQLLKKYRYWPG